MKDMTKQSPELLEQLESDSVHLGMSRMEACAMSAMLGGDTLGLCSSCTEFDCSCNPNNDEE